MFGRFITTALVMAAMTDIAAAADPVVLYAAGSLRLAMTEIATAFEAEAHTPVEARFGASGTLRAAITESAPADIFASANMEHHWWLPREAAPL
jgi:ABC-type molybdate transport system substrate-binding protein